MKPELIPGVAEAFAALGDPTRLALMQALRDGDRTVGQLAALRRIGQASASKHLHALDVLGFVSRRRDGASVWYHLADDGVFELCDVVCGQLRSDAAQRGRVVTARTSR